MFKALNTAYENWNGNAAQAGQRGRNQAAPQPYHTTFQFNPTYFRSNFCRQNEPCRETPQQARAQSSLRLLFFGWSFPLYSAGLLQIALSNRGSCGRTPSRSGPGHTLVPDATVPSPRVEGPWGSVGRKLRQQHVTWVPALKQHPERNGGRADRRSGPRAHVTAHLTPPPPRPLPRRNSLWARCAEDCMPRGTCMLLEAGGLGHTSVSSCL